jgi:hypothetical protein
MGEPTTQDWATATVGYLSEAYGLEPAESLALVDDVIPLLADLDLHGDPSKLRMPVRVLDQAAGRLTFPADQAGVRAQRPLRLSAEVWADFVCQFIGASTTVPPERLTVLFQQVTDLLNDYELPDRDVVYLSSALQTGLSVDVDDQAP